MPAIRTAQGFIIGKPGDTHEDALSRHPDYPRISFDKTQVRGFMNDAGKFMSRKEAFIYAMRHRLLNDSVNDDEDELQSPHLFASVKDGT